MHELVHSKIGIMLGGLLLMRASTVLGAAGDLDPSFGVGGIATLGSARHGNGGLVLQPDGRILVAGSDGVSGLMARFDAAGALDPSFGVGGVATELGPAISALALQPDGKVIAASQALTVLMLARFDQSGQVDFPFGVQFLPTPHGGWIEDVALQGDGKIVVSGHLCVEGTSCTSGNGSDVFVARFHADGSLDSSFGTSGFAQLDLEYFDSAPGVVVQPDGKVVAATSTGLVRWTSGGLLDPTFGSGGLAPIGSGQDVMLQPDGKIVMASGTVRRVDSSGILDAGFGVGGEVVLGVGGYGAALQSDGKIVVSGTGSLQDLTVVRLSGAGGFDPTFGNGGLVTIPGLALFSVLGNVVIQPDGRVLAAGAYGYEGPLVLIRLLGDEICGDGSVEGGEQCDDGNLSSGDCCSGTCQLEVVGSPCPGSGSCTVGVCDGAGTCEQTVPANAGCMPALAGWAKLTLKNDLDDARDKVTWKWAPSALLDKADFGTPLTTTNMTLCVADGDGNLLFSASAPAAAPCGTGGCWRETPGGFKYADAALANGAVQKLKLQEGITGIGRIVSKARGTALGLPSGPFATPVRVRLLREDLSTVCWDATYSAPTRNEAGVFKARSD